MKQLVVRKQREATDVWKQRAGAAIAQLAARRSHNPKVVSGILPRRMYSARSFFCRLHGILVVVLSVLFQLLVLFFA